MLTLTFISPTCPERGGTLPGSIAAGRERARASRCRSPADDAARAGTQPAADSNPAAPAPAAHAAHAAPAPPAAPAAAVAVARCYQPTWSRGSCL